MSDIVTNGFITNSTHEYITIFTDQNTAKRIKLEDVEYSKRSLKGDNILKSPKSRAYNIIESYAGSKDTKYGIIEGDTRIIKSSEINIMEKPSVGSVIDKGNIENIFKEARLKVIDDNNTNIAESKENIETKTEIENAIIESTNIKEPKQEEKIEEKQEETTKEEVYETMTMSDFFDEFKI